MFAALELRDAGDEDAFRAAVERVVFVHRVWPLIAFEQAMSRAEAELERRRLEYEAWLVETADRLCPERPIFELREAV